MQKVEFSIYYLFNIYYQSEIKISKNELSIWILNKHQLIRLADIMILETEQQSETPRSLQHIISLETRYAIASDPCNLNASAWVTAYVDFLERTLGLSASASILDLACGKAPVSIELAKRGYKVIALDRCGNMLMAAMEQALKESVSLTLRLCEDLEFGYENQMNFILLRNSMFGTCPTDKENERMLANVSKSLKAGGRCLIEVYNKDFAINHGIENKYFYNKTTDRFHIKDGCKLPTAESVKLYSEMQLRKMMGLQRLKIKSFEGWSFDKDPSPPPYRMNYLIAQKL